MLKHRKIPVIIGDIGGTNSRLSIVKMSKEFEEEIEVVKTQILHSKAFDSLSDLLKTFLEPFKDTEDYPVIGVIGIPGPIFDNTFTIIVNLKWPKTYGGDLAKELNLKSLTFLNDFVTNGYGITSNMIPGVDYENMNDNQPSQYGPIAMIGAGTGLGFGYLIKTVNSKYYYVFPSEGGHQDFAPQNEKEWRYYQFLKNHYNIDHVSVERACCGPAIPLMFLFHSEVENMESQLFLTKEEKEKLTPEDVIKYGLSKQCRICEATIEFFIEIYGAAAGNMSLLLIPTGGIYLLGGVSVALSEYIIKSETFRKRFKEKGRLEPLLGSIPLYLVKNSLIGVKGAEEYARRIIEEMS